MVSATSGSASSSLRMFGSKEIWAPAALASSTPRRTAAADAGAEQRGAHDVEVAAAREQAGLELAGVQRGRSRVRDVVDEVAAAVGAVGDEGAAGGRAGHTPDRADVDAAAASRSRLSVPKSSGPTQPIMAVAGADAGGLIGEDGRRAAWVRAGEQARLQEGLADLGRHDLDQDLADRHHLCHRFSHHHGTPPADNCLLPEH